LKIEDLTKEELVDLVKSYEAKKKYGLVWDDEHSKEDIVNSAKDYLPIFSEVKNKRVLTSGNTQNNYLIEGDNYFVLNSLLYTHSSGIDVIYIDPPYNTGNKDFKYNDTFVLREDSYRHSKWLNFMAKRLSQAKTLLKNDGVIFISIDDNEMAQLRILCDEIFGEKNFIACFVWEKKRKASNLDSRVRGITEYVLAYGKSNARSIIHPFDVVEEEKPYPFYNSGNSRSVLNFPAGITFSGLQDGTYQPAEFKAKKTFVKLLDKLIIKNKVSVNHFRLEGEWRYSQKWLDKAIANQEEIVFKGVEFKPYWINKDPERSKKMKTLLNYENYQIGTNEDGNEELFSLLGENDFSFPKPTSLVKALLSASTSRDSKDVVLDFFAGSGTTGDAVLQLNSEDGGNRQFILVTNNEGNICEDITYPRLCRVIEGYNDSKSNKVDGLGGGIYYLKNKFVKRTLNSDEMKIRLSENCIDLLCFKEGIFDEIALDFDCFRLFKNDEKVIGIYYSFDYSEIQQFYEVISKYKEFKKKVFVFTFDSSGLNPNDFLEWKDIELEPIPQKILERIGDLYAY
jgi:adenine-specific DNA-methyltransferase